MNITQAAAIYDILRELPESDPFWSTDYPKCRCIGPVVDEGLSLEEWYTNQKQYHWGSPARRNFIDAQLA